jgi:hypothetical protein
MIDTTNARETFLAVANDIAVALGTEDGATGRLGQEVAAVLHVALDVLGLDTRVRLLHSLEPAICTHAVLECVLGEPQPEDAPGLYRALLAMNLANQQISIGQYAIDQETGGVVYLYPFALHGCEPEVIAQIARMAFEASRDLLARPQAPEQVPAIDNAWLAA